MSQNKTHDDKFERLRQLAEEMISRLPIADRPEPAEMPDLISDLRVYEAELEIQNEDLKRAQETNRYPLAEGSHCKVCDFYRRLCPTT